eukprot:TRINITY_DN11312_c0_g1_i2.p1 TRINITY_DN11312_c0_g1~~TRINITY_DN11312_c0_g1_i2.p1  ORF type:complete len:104 (-),score=26.62 TRINITY_DN11312_c0_g1_i2:28-339(-)
MRILLGLLLLACVALCLATPSSGDCKDGDCQDQVGRNGGLAGASVNSGGGARGRGRGGARGGRSGSRSGRSGSGGLAGRTNSFSVQGVLITIVALLVIHLMKF